jgi:lycopene beta-cyclase
MDKYDYIIAGAGCAGLSLLHYIYQDSSLHQKKILVIDQNLKKSNDRTWCFWEEESSDFESLLTTSWNSISIHNGDQNFYLPTAPFTYKMIEGLSFYESIITKTRQSKHIEWKEAKIQSIKDQTVYWEGGAATAKFIFSSILQYNPVFNDDTDIQQLNDFAISNTAKPFLWQHFKGVTIEFENEVFDDSCARWMDFNVDQQNATAFMYVLPISHQKALVEYTVFSRSLLEKATYDIVIHSYLAKYYAKQSFIILHEEYGAIPMTQNSFTSNQTSGYIPIGTIGGAVKASTGFAFKSIQQQTRKIAKALSKGEQPNAVVKKTRYSFYDAVLLDILFHHKMAGAEIFTRIFSKNKASTVFRFLSNTSTIFDDIKIMITLPTRLFLFTAIRILLRWK